MSCRAICTRSCVATRRLLAWAAYRVRDGRDRGAVHSQARYFQDQAVMLGLLGRAMVGFAGPDSELQRGGKKKGSRRVRECTRLHVWKERFFSFFFFHFCEADIGLTMVVRAVFPERLPFPEIERHATLGVDYHR